MPLAVRAEFRSQDLAHAVKRLRDLDKRYARNALKKAARRASKKLVRELKQKTPKDTGTLGKSHGSKVITKQKGAVIIAVIGPRSNFIKDTPKGKRWAGKYWHWIEEGRKGRGGYPGKFILRKLLAENETNIINTFVSELNQSIREFGSSGK